MTYSAGGGVFGWSLGGGMIMSSVVSKLIFRGGNVVARRPHAVALLSYSNKWLSNKRRGVAVTLTA